MFIVNEPDIRKTWDCLLYNMREKSSEVQTRRWQGVEIQGKPGSAMRELLNVVIEAQLGGIEDLDHWRTRIKPNLPWADDHFEKERVSGCPLNPGETWKQWPYALSADRHRTEGERFNHAYAERIWPKYARRTVGGKLYGIGPGTRKYPSRGDDMRPLYGIAHHYGDLDDLVELLAREPDTRQAWIPLFFPEDTGTGDGSRKMCSLGYQVIVRGGRANMYYPLRSCDLRRHWRDDAYLAIRLLLWIIDRCREINPDAWRDVVPGTLTMHMTSLHCFVNDWRELTEGKQWA
jgi:thymidylate synthase